jgi:hypothetical protein
MAEVYDPTDRSFSATGTMTYQRQNHTVAVTANGTVLIAGGQGSQDASVTSEEYRLTTQSFLLPLYIPNAHDSGHGSVLMDDWRLLLVGGGSEAASIFDTSTNAWISAPPMSLRRDFSAVTRLDAGKVMVCGGVTVDADLRRTVTGSAEILDLR